MNVKPTEVVKMTQAEFDRLPEYSLSVPTLTIQNDRVMGVRIWKRKHPARAVENFDWFRGEYVNVTARQADIIWKKIEIVK